MVPEAFLPPTFSSPDTSDRRLTPTSALRGVRLPRAMSDEERLLIQCTFLTAESSCRGEDPLSGIPASPHTTEWRRA